MLCMKVLMLLVINNYSTQPVCLIPQKGGKKRKSFAHDYYPAG